MTKSRDARGVPGDGATTVTPPSKSQLVMGSGSDGFRLLDTPDRDRRVLTYVVEHGSKSDKKRYSRTVYTEEKHRTFSMHQYEKRIKPRLTKISVAPKWERRMEDALGNEALIKAFLRKLGQGTPDYEYHVTKNRPMVGEDA